MSEIMHALGYLSGAVGIGFAFAFGLYAGIQAGSHAFGPFTVNVKMPAILLKNGDDIHGIPR